MHAAVSGFRTGDCDAGFVASGLSLKDTKSDTHIDVRWSQTSTFADLELIIRSVRIALPVVRHCCI